MVIKNPNAIYTQEDYDKVTDLYNTYQQSKDKYTPEQQKEIERKFAEAWVAASNRIEDSNKKFIDMWNDEQGNSWWKYWDWRIVLLNEAPKKTWWKRIPQNPTYDFNAEPWTIPTYQSPYSWEDRRYSWARNAEYWAWYIDQFDNKKKK